MYLHIGDDVVVALADVVAIIDVTSMEQGTSNRSYLQKAIEAGTVVTVNAESTNAWVITNHKIYASPVASATLKKRAGFLDI